MAEAIETLRKRITPVKEGKYLLGLSGGADSVALMMLLLPAILPVTDVRLFSFHETGIVLLSKHRYKQKLVRDYQSLQLPCLRNPFDFRVYIISIP